MTKITIEDNTVNKSDVTYSVGDIINTKVGYAILAQVGSSSVQLISIVDGNRFASPIIVMNLDDINKEEMLSISGGMSFSDPINEVKLVIN